MYYAVGLVDDAMGRAMAEGMTDCWQIRLETVAGNLGQAKDALAKIANETVRTVAVALADVVTDKMAFCVPAMPMKTY